mgnify:CR=1 FL=1
MKYLLLLLLISPFTIALDLSIPEENVDWSEFEERPGEVWDHPDIKLFQINFPDNPATDNQRKLFWVLAAADVWTTNRGLKEPGTYERNPFLGKNPSLEKIFQTFSDERINIEIKDSKLSGLVGLIDLINEYKMSDNIPGTITNLSLEQLQEVSWAWYKALARLERERKFSKVSRLEVIGPDGREYVHKGISTKKFERKFRLSEYVEVTGAEIKDGLLAIQLEVIVPDNKQPRKIDINRVSKPQLLNEDHD